MNKLLGVLSLFIWANPVFSSLITSNVTGADMAGIEVTAYFAGGGSETVTWLATSTDNSIPFQEGYAGGVTGTGWALAQQGNTFGDVTPAGQQLGVWSLSSEASLIALEIDALIAGFVFDNVFSIEHTSGSGVGRPFVSNQFPGPDAVYGDLFSSPDLYGSLTLDWGRTEFVGDMLFMADTDRLSVPEPAGVLLLAAGLFGMAGVRARGKKHQATQKNED